MWVRQHKEDQILEAEAVNYIYMDDVETLATEPFHILKIKVTTDESKDDDPNGLSCKVIITFTEKYPDTAPLVEIDEAVNFEDDFEEKLLEHISEIINENLGTEMVLTIVCGAQEWLKLKYDEIKENKEAMKILKQKADEEAEQIKFEGTRVSVETFLVWRSKFDFDTGITSRKEKLANEAKKLTGKELFLQDKTLIESDLKFLLEAGDSIENVKIDEALFQNLDDLELDDSDTSDDDYVPGKDID